MNTTLLTALLFITSFTSSATITIIIIFYLRNRNRVALEYAAGLLGAQLQLTAELLRFSRVAVNTLMDAPSAYAILSTLGLMLVTFSLLNLAPDIVIRKPLVGYRIATGCFTIFVVATLVIGYTSGRLRLVAAAGIMEGIAGCMAAFLVIIRHRRIGDVLIRRIAIITSVASFAALPFVVIQQVWWSRSTNPFAGDTPQIPQVILSLSFHLATIIVGLSMFIRMNRNISDSLDMMKVHRFGISPRECDIILHIGKGYSNDEIASRLFISTSTVKNHIYHIYMKTGIHNRVELVNAVLKKTMG